MNKEQKKIPSKVRNIKENHSSQLFDKCELKLFNNGLNFGILDTRKHFEDVIAHAERVIPHLGIEFQERILIAKYRVKKGIT